MSSWELAGGGGLPAVKLYQLCALKAVLLITPELELRVTPGLFIPLTQATQGEESPWEVHMLS